MAKLKIMKKQPVDIDSVLAANKHLNFVKRMFIPNPATIQVPGEPYPSTHLMEVSDGIAYPRVIERPFNQGLHYFKDWRDAHDYAKRTGEFIKFPSDKEALEFTQKYKTGKNVTIGK